MGLKHNQPPVTTYTENCTVLGFLTVPVTVNFFGRAPGATHPGAPVDLSGVRNTVTVPASFVNQAIELLGLTSLTGQITTSDINGTNTTQGTVNTIPTPIPFTAKLTEGQPAIFQFPSSPVTVGSWTAGGSGTIIFTPGDLDVTLTAPNGLTASVSCAVATTPHSVPPSSSPRGPQHQRVSPPAVAFTPSPSPGRNRRWTVDHGRVLRGVGDLQRQVSCTASSSGPLTCQVSGLPIYHRLGYRTFTIRVKAVNGSVRACSHHIGHGNGTLIRLGGTSRRSGGHSSELG